MSLPEPARVELPILQELAALGGTDQVRYLYRRLARHFPHLIGEALEAEVALEPDAALERRWQALVRRAGRLLADRGELRRDRTRWTLTARGARRLEAEALQPLRAPIAPASSRAISHGDAQSLLVELGRLLGHDAEAEVDHYDVIWRSSPVAPRLSHVFEVQVAGSVDSALTRLKQAWEQQRSRPFLVVADERSARFADQRLASSFHELRGVITVLGIGELEQLHHAVAGHAPLLHRLMSGD